MDWIALGWAGFVATTFATAFFWIGRTFDWTLFSPTVQLGCLVTADPRRPFTETVGFAILLLLGSTLVPALFRAILDAWRGPPWIGGIIVGGFLGLGVAASLPLTAAVSRCVRRGIMPPPGPFGIGWGNATPGIIFAGHMIYGGIVAAILGGF